MRVQYSKKVNIWTTKSRHQGGMPFNKDTTPLKTRQTGTEHILLTQKILRCDALLTAIWKIEDHLQDSQEDL